MSDFYVSYNKADALAKSEAEQIIATLKATAIYVGGETNIKPRLIEAEYLIVIFASEEDFLNKSLAEDYNYFLDELKWKRKKVGTIIMYVPSGISFARVPFKLKNCYYFNYGEASSLAEYIADAEKAAKKDVAVVKRVTSPKEIKYVPHPPQVTQIIFSARAPSVQSFDGKINYDTYESEACKDDHSYDSKKTNAKSYITEELERPTITSANSVNAGSPPKRKNASCGCVASIFVALLIISIAIFIIVAIVNNMNLANTQAIIQSVKTLTLNAPLNTTAHIALCNML